MIQIGNALLKWNLICINLAERMYKVKYMVLSFITVIIFIIKLSFVILFYFSVNLEKHLLFFIFKPTDKLQIK